MFRFTIREVLWWTALVALGLALVRCIPYLPPPLSDPGILLLMCAAAGFTGARLGAVWRKPLVGGTVGVCLAVTFFVLTYPAAVE
jgi:hypothetical protein